MFNLNFMKNSTYNQNNKIKNNCINKLHCNNCNCQTNQFDNKFHRQIKSLSDSSSNLHSIISAENSS